MFLHIADISHRYRRGGDVLHNVSLSVERGEVLVIAGPSGSGKSTLLGLIDGTLGSPKRGSIVLGGACINGTPTQARDIAAVSQGGVLFEYHSVFKNIALPLLYQRPRLTRQEIQERVEYFAKMLRIYSLLGRPYSADLSGGEKQRVSLARALVRRKSLLLLDEPLSWLDAPLGWRLLQDILHIAAKEGITLVWVAHDPREAAAAGHHIAVLQEGRIVQVGTWQELREHPQSEFVAEWSALGPNPA